MPPSRSIGRARATAAPVRPTAPPVPAMLVALDPGTRHLGYAVLRGDETLVVSGTWIPRSTLSVLERHLWLHSRIQDLLADWQPGVLAFEEFVWKMTEGESHPVRGRSAMERLIGGIEALALAPPYPVLMPLLPQVWGAQLFGQAQHTKAQIAWAVNQRLGTSYTGSVYDNHEADAVGIALVALDTLRHAEVVRQRGGSRRAQTVAIQRRMPSFAHGAEGSDTEEGTL